jgi:hypothetical protein
VRSSGLGGAGGPAAGASALSRYRELVAQNRWERLLIRVLLAAGAGVVAAGLTVWWAGLAVAAVGIAGHAVYTRVRPSPANNWRRGAIAECRTGRRLARLDPAGFHILHDRALPGTKPGAHATNLDHLVVGLTGVYAIASRRWRWGMRLRAEEGRLWVGRRPAGHVRTPALRAASSVAGMLAEKLDHKVDVEAVVAVHGPRLPRGGLRFGTDGDAIELHTARNLPHVIAGRPVIYTSAQVATIAAAAESVLPAMPLAAHAAHTADAERVADAERGADAERTERIARHDTKPDDHAEHAEHTE